MFLLSFLLIPIVAAILLLFIQQEKRAQNIAIVASVLSLAAAVNMLFINVSTVDLTWLQVLNSRFVLQADGLAKILILLTAISFPAIFIATSKNQVAQKNIFLSLMLFTQAGLMGVFLAGDALLSWAFQIISDQNLIKDSRQRSEICFALAKAIGPYGMVGGQQADMDLNNKSSLSLDEIEWIQNHKTGVLISSCSHVASILLNVNDKQRDKIISYASNIGLAFQIADDLLDKDGDETVMGKPVKQDDKNETPNFVTILGRDKATKRALEVSNSAISIIENFGYGIENLVSLAKYTVNRNH